MHRHYDPGSSSRTYIICEMQASSSVSEQSAFTMLCSGMTAYPQFEWLHQSMVNDNKEYIHSGITMYFAFTNACGSSKLRSRF
jgi:hypothetical protein